VNLVVGIGLRSGTPYRELRDLVQDALQEAGGGTVRLVVTVAGRETEPGVQRLVASLNAELRTAPAEELAGQPVPTPSEKVEHLSGTPGVAEAAVLLTGAELLVTKRRSASATAAVGRLPHAGPAAATADRAPGYAPADRAAVHRVIAERRDVRRGFLQLPVPDQVLGRVLEAAQRAPSVGLSQPWDFLLIRDVATRRKVHDLATVQRDAFAASLPSGRRQSFDGLKIEAILDTPLNIAVTCDPGRGGRHVLGRHADPRTTWFSVAIAIQNLWLAARAEGLGVGWVSFFEPTEVAAVLDLPAHIELVGYLCVGYVEEFAAAPELVRTGWAARRPLAWAVHQEEWGQRGLPGVAPTSIVDDAVQAEHDAVQTSSQQLVRLIVGGDPAQYLEQPEALVVQLTQEKPAADFGVLWRPARTPVEAVELGVELARDLALQGVGEFDIQLAEHSELADAMARGLRVGASACGVTMSA
jgi:5,6-dimethylbenzimidazole synthase